MARRVFSALLLAQLPLDAQAELPGDCASGCPGAICCMHCGAVNGTEGPFFDCRTATACQELGGQVKPPQTSHFSRPPARPWSWTPSQLAHAGDGPEQVHLIGGYPDEVTVVYMTKRATDSGVEFRVADKPDHTFMVSGRPHSYSTYQIPSGWPGYDSDGFQPGGNVLAACTTTNPEAYTLQSCIYTSGVIHTVHLRELRPGTRYEYRPAGSQRWRSFRTPPAVGRPIRFGVTADLGQTQDSLATMQHLRTMLDANQLDSLLFPGDLSYADGFGPAWDSWGRMAEFLLDSVPTAYGVGNHEYAAGFENFVHWIPRHGWPATARSSSTSPQWYSFQAGLAHVIMLCSYCDYSEDSLQHAWLARELKNVDRARTPWLIATWHTPWYVSSKFHTVAEGAAMRNSMERLLYQHKVDVVFSGHMHAYERTVPVYQGQPTCDAPVYITVGDGGNHEGPACPWQKDQPAWSARREFSFGHGVFVIPNATHAQWAWHRNQDGQATFADGLWLQPAALRCGETEAASEAAPAASAASEEIVL